jgi:hypothetical protein
MGRHDVHGLRRKGDQLPFRQELDGLMDYVARIVGPLDLDYLGHATITRQKVRLKGLGQRQAAARARCHRRQEHSKEF